MNGTKTHRLLGTYVVLYPLVLFLVFGPKIYVFFLQWDVDGYILIQHLNHNEIVFNGQESVEKLTALITSEKTNEVCTNFQVIRSSSLKTVIFEISSFNPASPKGPGKVRKIALIQVRISTITGQLILIPNE